MESSSAVKWGLPVELIHLYSDEKRFCQAAENAYIIKSVLEDGTVAWSLRPEIQLFFSNTLLPPTRNYLGSTMLKLICFSCPPCYEGNTHWYV